MAESSKREEAIELIRQSFPDIRCLRCGFDEFYVDTDVDALGTGKPGGKSILRLHNLIKEGEPTLAARFPVVTLACTRCGHIENHITSILMEAEKPLRPYTRDNDQI